MTTTSAVSGRHGSGPDDGGRITLEQLFANPFPAYREMQDAGVMWVESVGRWMVTRWDDVGAVETMRDDFSANETNSNLTRVIGMQMLRADGAAHKRLRTAAQDPLRPNAIGVWTDAFQRITDGLIDAMIEKGGTADLVADFCTPFSGLCLAEVLGLPNATADDIHRWSSAIMNGSSNYADDPAVWAAAAAVMREVDAAVEDALSGEGPPPGSLIHAMSTNDGAGRPLEFDELCSNVKVMIGGGYNEPRDAIGTAALGLLGHPDQLAAVLADEALWPRVVEESVRWVAPIGVAPREVLRPLQLCDTELEPGARVMVNFAAANRDPRHWARPDDFDIHRPKGRNVAFGVGHHFCLGVWMARHQVGAIALPTLFKRLHDIELDLDQPPTVRGWVFRGPTEMWIKWRDAE